MYNIKDFNLPIKPLSYAITERVVYVFRLTRRNKEMSLFKSRELWSTVCGKDESFDSGCMVAADILSRGFDCIIVGSHGGLLRIFQPNPDSENDAIGYQPTDLLIETQLPLPIIQVAVGRLTS